VNDDDAIAVLLVIQRISVVAVVALFEKLLFAPLTTPNGSSFGKMLDNRRSDFVGWSA
jgi:hypothetical protein